MTMQAFKASYLQLKDNSVETKIIGAGSFVGAAKKAESQESAGNYELRSLERDDETVIL
jgi:hypothetical protein